MSIKGEVWCIGSQLPHLVKTKHKHALADRTLHLVVCTAHDRKVLQVTIP